MRPDRLHPRRGRHRPPVVSHAPDPAQNVAADLDAPVPVDSWDEVQGRAETLLANVSRETLGEEAAREALLEAADAAGPPLSRERIAKLEALTALWVRDVRVGGPGPDDTLLYASPRKPPPPPRREAALDATGVAETDPLLAGRLREPEPVKPPRVVRDWASRHDPKSRGFDVSDRIRVRVPVQDRLWPAGPVFDQGTTPPLSLHDASGCVGMATAAAGNALAIAAGAARGGGADRLLTKEDALQLYAAAQRLDHVSGESYAGTSVLAGMKAGVEAGLWDEYLWAFGTRDIAQALLQVGPVVIGIPWFTGLEDPDPAGVIRPTGSPAGGHALALVGILASKPGGPWFVAQQSRGPNVGDGGRVLIHHKDLTRLRAGVGEAAIPVPPGATL